MTAIAPEVYIPTPWPVVFTDDAVTARLGEPAVQHEGLAELFYGDLGIPTDVLPRVDLKRIPKTPFNLFQDIYGEHKYFSDAIAIDPLKTTAPDAKLSLNEVLLHEAQHLADDVLYPTRSKVHVAARLAVAAIGTGISYKAFANGALPDVGEWLVDATGTSGTERSLYDFVGTFTPSLLTGGILSPLAYYQVDPAENSARSTQNNAQLVQKYQDVITFPDA